MKTILFSLCLLVASATSILAGNENGTYTLNTKSSKIEWKADKVTGSHNGTVLFKNGSFNVKDGKLTGGSFEVEMASIHVSDLEGEWKDKLEGHLKAEDFFNTAKFATAKFEITKAEYTPNEGTNYKITGKMTIKGITNEVSFLAKVNFTEKTITATTEFKIDRTKWDIKYGSGQFYSDLGDKMIYDEFLLKISIVAGM